MNTLHLRKDEFISYIQRNIEIRYGAAPNTQKTTSGLLTSFLVATNPANAQCVVHLMDHSIRLDMTLAPSNEEEMESAMQAIRDANMVVTDHYGDELSEMDIYYLMRVSAMREYKHMLMAEDAFPRALNAA